MANSAAVNFLQEYKDRYPLESLRRQLHAQGYPETVVTEAVKVVYGGTKLVTPQGNHPGGFFDSRRRFTYTTTWLKVWDFVLGLLAGGILSLVQFVGYEFFYLSNDFFGLFAPLGIRLMLLVLLFRTRRWMMFGLLAASVLAWSSLVYPLIQLVRFGFYY